MLNVSRYAVIGDNFCGNNSCKYVNAIVLYGVVEVGNDFCGDRSCTMMSLMALPSLQSFGTNFCDSDGGLGGFGCSSLQSIIIGPGTSNSVIQHFAAWKKPVTAWCRDTSSFLRCQTIEADPASTITCVLSM